MVKVAFHDGCQLDFEGLNASDSGDTFFATKTMDVEFAIVDMCDIVVFEEEDSFGVFDDGGGVGSEEEFYGDGDPVFGEERAGLRAVKAGFHRRVNWERQEVGRTGTVQSGRHFTISSRALYLRGDTGGSFCLSVGVKSTKLDIDEVDFEFLLRLDADEERTALTRRNDFIWIVNALEEQSVRALEFPDDKFGELRKVNVAFLLVKDIFCELGNAFRVRLSFKDVSLVLQDCFQFAVIGDDAVVDDDKFSFRITPEWGLESPQLTAGLNL